MGIKGALLIIVGNAGFISSTVVPGPKNHKASTFKSTFSSNWVLGGRV